MDEPTKADVRDMLTAAVVLSRVPLNLSPALPDRDDVQVIAEHIGATGIRITRYGAVWEMQCPACGVWDFGPTMELRQAVETWLHGGYLPSGGLLGGVCMACEHITNPKANDLSRAERLTPVNSTPQEV